MTVQQKLVKNNWFRLAVSVTLTLAVLVVFVFAPFNTAHAIVGVDDAVIAILIAGLASVGITFAVNGAFNSLSDYVGGLFEEYASDNNTTVYALTNGLNAGANSAGKLLLNNRWVLLIDTFATWVKAKFNLQNNTNVNIVRGGITFGDLTGYALPWHMSYNNVDYDSYLITTATDAVVFCVTTGSNNQLCHLSLITKQANQIARWVQTVDGQTYVTDYNVTSYNQNTEWYYYDVSPSSSTVRFTSNGYETCTQAEFNNAIGNYDDTETSDVPIDVQVGTIEVPTDNPDYTAGDGAILDVGAAWGRPYTGVVNGEIPAVWPQVVAGTVNPAITYEPEGVIEGQLPAPSEIENLPGGMTVFDPDNPNGDIGDIFNLRLNTIWHYVQQWIYDFSVAGGFLWNTATALPNPVVNMVYAMVVIALVFGLIKIFRG